MSRLAAAVRLDLRLQWRYGLYVAALFVSAVWIVVLRQVPRAYLEWALPFVIFVDLAVFGFYFLGGAVLFEKGEGTLAAIVVSPLRVGEYLASKLVTLTAASVLVSLVVALATFGTGFNIPMLATGVALNALLTLLVGFIAVSRYETISEYLIPSQIYLLPLAVPLIDFAGLWHNPVLYLIPTQGSLLMLHGAFAPIAPRQLAYAVVVQLFWIAALVPLARRAFERHIVARRGGR
jgi:fluoroquinolone transport system permease protein